MATTRYSAGIQRAKGLMEMAAALYDSSLSYQTRRAAIESDEVNAIFDEGIKSWGQTALDHPPVTFQCRSACGRGRNMSPSQSCEI